jgi:hypothetical protein
MGGVYCAEVTDRITVVVWLAVSSIVHRIEYCVLRIEYFVLRFACSVTVVCCLSSVVRPPT